MSELVSDNFISLKEAAARLNMTEEGFAELMKSLAGTRCMDRWDEGSWDMIPIDTEGSLP